MWSLHNTSIKGKTSLILAVCALLSVSCTVYGYTEPGKKKLIHFGWSAPSTVEQFLKTDIRDFDARCPFDGIGIYPSLNLKRDGKIVRYNPVRAAGDPQLLTWEDCEEWIPVLRRLQETRLKHNFIRCNSSMFNGNWFDDEVWKRTLNNYGMMARMAKEAGFEGLCVDLEGYPYTKKPFMFRQEFGHSFEETAAQVRKRGKEWIEEVNRQFPDLTLFTFVWTIMNCDSDNRALHPELNCGSQDELLTAFFNGIYDGASDTMKIVDGQEIRGYYAATDMDFDRIAANYRSYADAWIDPANYGKFRKITSMGMALYLDSYVKKSKPTRFDHLNDNFSDPTTLLAHNVMKTLSRADEYAWIWCERGTFWPDAEFNSAKGKKLYPFWDEILPSCTEAIRFGRDWAKGIPSLAGKNIARNGSLEPGESEDAAGPDQNKSGILEWWTWQSGSSPKGTIVPENGMVRFVNVTDGSIAQIFDSDVRPGRKYILTARCKNESRVSMPQLSFFFSNRNSQGLWDTREFGLFTEEDSDGWKRATLLINVPDGRNITRLTVTLGTKGTQDPADKGVLFDDVALYEVEYPWEK